MNGGSPGEHLVADDAERVEVADRPSISRSPAPARATCRPACRSPCPVAVSRLSPPLDPWRARCRSRSPARGPSSRVEQDVVRLDVAVHDAARRGRRRARRRPRAGSGATRRSAAAPRSCRRLREVVAARCTPSRRTRARPARRPSRSGRCCGCESCAAVSASRRKRDRISRAEGQLRRQQLDGDLTLQPAVAGAIDDAHAAPSDLAVELVVGAERALDDERAARHPRQWRAGRALSDAAEAKLVQGRGRNRDSRSTGGSSVCARQPRSHRHRGRPTTSYIGRSEKCQTLPRCRVGRGSENGVCSCSAAHDSATAQPRRTSRRALPGRLPGRPRTYFIEITPWHSARPSPSCPCAGRSSSPASPRPSRRAARERCAPSRRR